MHRARRSWTCPRSQRTTSAHRRSSSHSTKYAVRRPQEIAANGGLFLTHVFVIVAVATKVQQVLGWVGGALSSMLQSAFGSSSSKYAKSVGARAGSRHRSCGSVHKRAVGPSARGYRPVGAHSFLRGDLTVRHQERQPVGPDLISGAIGWVGHVEAARRAHRIGECD